MKTLIVLISFLSVAYSQVKICLHTQQSVGYCDQLNTGTSDIQCIKAFGDSVQCAKMVQRGDADFTVLQPEQAYLASEFINEQTAVIGEIRAERQQTLVHNFQMVTIVRKDHTGGRNGLRGKRYCHPGFTGHDLWTPRALKEFEYVLLQDVLKRDCENKENITSVEQEIKALNDFFGESCRNGPWTQDRNLNERLVRDNAKLTSLCTGSGEQDALQCLKIKNGDVAYTTLNEAFRMPEKDEYRVLCQNDTLVPIRLGMPPQCVWRNQPWPLIVANRNKAENVRSSLKSWIDPSLHASPAGTPFAGASSRSESWQQTLATILLGDTNNYRLFLLNDQPLIVDYLRRNNQEIFPRIKTDCPMRWCTVNENDEEKCNWLARAASLVGIEPQVSCVAGLHIYDCLKKIYDKNADIIAIDSNYGYIARKAGMQNLLYSKASANDIASIITVIRDDSSIQNFNDLKSRRACFPEYRGIAWVSFIDTAHRFQLIENSCDFSKDVSEFFTEICAPGAQDDRHYRQSNEMNNKLCSICSDNCESDINNRYFNNSGALACLDDNRADVAFVEWQAIEKLPNLGKYRVLCTDNRVVSMDDYKRETDACSLSNTVDSEVISRNTDARKYDYKLGLLDMDEIFGSSFKNEKIFRMFKEFDGMKNLLFKENVLGLADDQSDNKFVQNYIKLFESVDKCTSSSSIIQPIVSLLITSFVLLITFKY